MFAFALEVRLADRNHVLVLGHFALGVVEHLAFEEEHGIVVANGGFEQPLRVVRRRRRHHFQAGPVNEPRFRILRMVEATANVASAWRSHDNRHGRPAAIPISQRGRLIDNLIEAARDEIGELHLGHGTVATQRRADADADDGRLRNGCIDHPCLAEFLKEALGDAERAAVFADVLARHEDLRIPPHLFAERFADRFEIGELFRHTDP